MIRELISSLSLLVFLYAIFTFFFNEIYQKGYYQIPFQFTLLFLLISIYTGTRNYKTFDFETGTIESVISFGIIKFKSVRKGAAFDYLSLVQDAGLGNNLFSVNVWRKNNAHDRIYTFQKYGEAINFAIMVSHKLELKLLDATDLQNKKWIESTKA